MIQHYTLMLQAMISAQEKLVHQQALSTCHQQTFLCHTPLLICWVDLKAGAQIFQTLQQLLQLH